MQDTHIVGIFQGPFSFSCSAPTPYTKPLCKPAEVACGAVQYPNHDQSEYLGLQLLKVQDTCPIHSAHMSQHVALGALQKGRPWLAGQLRGLEGNR